MDFIGFPTYRNHPKKPSRFIIADGFIAKRMDETLAVNSGTIVNGASIPVPFNLIFPRWHPHYNRPAALHDALVGEFNQPMAKVKNVDGSEYTLTWKESAVWFRDAMAAEGAPKYKRWIFYHCVMRFKDFQRLFR